MTDFIFMVKDSSYMFVTGPDVVKTVTNEHVTAEELGGATTHTRRSSVADAAFENDVEALSEIRRLVDFLPLSNRDKPPTRPFYDDPERVEESLDTLIPDNPNQPYDMKELITKVADEGDFYEIQEEFAGNIINRVHPAGGTDRGRGGEPAHGAGGRSGHRQRAQGRAVRAVLRLFRDPDPDLRGCAGLPAGDGAGV